MYAQLDVSSATAASGASAPIAARATSKMTSYSAPESHSTAFLLRRRHGEAVDNR